MADSIKDLHKAAEKLLKDQEKLAQQSDKIRIEREAIVDRIDVLKVEEMDQNVVDEAQRLGINPKNFDTTEHLQEGIELFKKSNKIK